MKLANVKEVEIVYCGFFVSTQVGERSTINYIFHT